MPSRNVTIQPYEIPGGTATTEVAVSWELVDANGVPQLGYDEVLGDGIAGVYATTVRDTAVVVPLQTTESLVPTLYWRFKAQWGALTGYRSYTSGLITLEDAGGDLTLVEFLALEAVPNSAAGLTADELAAIHGAASPDASNVFATIADVGASVADMPADGDTTVAISSNWAYDHVAASDPHSGYALDSDLTGALTPSSLILTDTVWDDLRFPAQGINTAGAPAPPNVDMADGTLVFSASATNIIAGVAQLPHHWKEGSTINPHIHWCPSNTNTGNVLWRFEYEVQNIGGTFSGFTTVDTLEAGEGTAEKHQVHSLGTISMTGKTLSCMMKWKLSRIGGDGTDTFTGTARLLEFDIHYEIDSLGSRSEMTK